MVSQKELEEIKKDVKELQAKVEGIYCMVQHLNRELCDLGIELQRDIDLAIKLPPLGDNSVIRIVKGGKNERTEPSGKSN